MKSLSQESRANISPLYEHVRGYDGPEHWEKHQHQLHEGKAGTGHGVVLKVVRREVTLRGQVALIDIS